MFDCSNHRTTNYIRLFHYNYDQLDIIDFLKLFQHGFEVLRVILEYIIDVRRINKTNLLTRSSKFHGVKSGQPGAGKHSVSDIDFDVAFAHHFDKLTFTCLALTYYKNFWHAV